MTKLGLNIPNFGPTASPGEMRDWVRFTQEHGFALAMVSDHVAVTPDVAELYPQPFYDPFTTLGWMAGYADGLELGTTVTILPYRHPLLTASMTAALHDFTEGRFILGVAAGWAEQEFAALGVDFASRGRISEEYVATIRAALRQETVGDVATGPVRRTPIWVGGTAPSVLRRAKAHGDAWHPNNAPLDWIREVGLPATEGVAFCPRMRARVTGHDPSPTRPPGTGSLDQVAGDFRQLIEMGAEYVVLDTNPDHPRDRLPAAEDRRNLAELSKRLA
ncbi:LLM class flavin-dependent oxidoreductase [Actinoplanes sp. NBRC 103695]|uniref:LLM class flavin-dependent oxidoreductase n=1 Tax=Actinoplanes sp. NBRC 103695 TaxID=3032202 RepID=UPI0024A55CF5|nr:LLM class flavin-dependent oxidoreductase [Actinoplanes sp. NBRC 103695]GLY93001.1 F420-dependent oxidoreductase [Actinoplanes sp. NBRC 103695]